MPLEGMLEQAINLTPIFDLLTQNTFPMMNDGAEIVRHSDSPVLLVGPCIDFEATGAP